VLEDKDRKKARHGSGSSLESSATLYVRGYSQLEDRCVHPGLALSLSTSAMVR
jgi:hypothetical protein